MSDPVAFVTTLEIHEGKLEQFKDGARRSVEYAEANGPHVMLGVYIDEEQMRAHGFQLHRDSESILSWWQMGDPYIQDVMQHVTTTHVDVYGQPSDAVMEGMRRLSGMGATLTVTPRLAGFTRFPGGG